MLPSRTQFNITTAANDTRHYHNLALNITLQNPNDYFRIHYHNTLLVADYRNRRRFAMAIKVADFRQPKRIRLPWKYNWIIIILRTSPMLGHQITTTLSSSFIDLQNTYKSKLRPVIHWHWNPLFTCDLTVPLKINGSQSANMTTSAFETTKCKPDHEHRYLYNWKFIYIYIDHQ